MIHFITGATSSIGKILVREALARGETVRALVRKTSRREGLELPGLDFVTGDVTDADSVLAGMEGAQRVTNLAAVVGGNLPEAEWWRVAREGSANLLAAALKLDIASYVQVSSLSVLGNSEMGSEARDESWLPHPSIYGNIYQKTKRASDDLVREAAAKGLGAKIVYPGFGYGCSKAQSHASMAEMTLLRMASDQAVAVMGSGKNRLCVAYYRDTALGILLAHDRGVSGEGYLLANGSWTFPELWKVIADVLGKAPPRRHIPIGLLKTISAATRLLNGRPALSDDFLDMVSKDWNFSNAKARRELGFTPRGLEESMAETWRDYLEAGWEPAAAKGR